jgi:hypothetical protein
VLDLNSNTSDLQAILAGSSNTAKLLGQRCTLHIELKEYSEALQDAKALVRLLPDAPAVSFPARCSSK